MELSRLVRKPLICVSEDISVMDAVRVMTEHKIGAVTVCEGPEIRGIFTERDLMRKVVLHGRDVNQTRVSDVMTRNVISIPATGSRREALRLMNESHIRHLPVLNDQGKAEGMVSLRNLLFDIMDDLQQEAAGLESYLATDGPGG